MAEKSRQLIEFSKGHFSVSTWSFFILIVATQAYCCLVDSSALSCLGVCCVLCHVFISFQRCFFFFDCCMFCCWFRQHCAPNTPPFILPFCMFRLHALLDVSVWLVFVLVPWFACNWHRRRGGEVDFFSPIYGEKIHAAEKILERPYLGEYMVFFNSDCCNTCLLLSS